MKKTISLLLYIVALISTIFGAVRIVLNYDLKGPSLLFYIIARNFFNILEYLTANIRDF